MIRKILFTVLVIPLGIAGGLIVGVFRLIISPFELLGDIIPEVWSD